MSSEIQFGFSLQISNGAYNDAQQVSQSIDQNAIGAGAQTQTVQTSTSGGPTLLSLAGVTTNGIAILQNLDATNYALWGPSSTGTSTGTMVVAGKLKPGESFPVRIAPAVVLFAEANTAPLQMLTMIYDD
jgi:hypothetical protein